MPYSGRYGQTFHSRHGGGRERATFAVRRSARLALAEAGFDVRKQPGPPEKRERLVARRAAGTV